MKKELLGICLFDWLIYSIFCLIGGLVSLLISLYFDLAFWLKIALPIFVFSLTLIMFLFARGLGGPNEIDKKPMITN